MRSNSCSPVLRRILSAVIDSTLLACILYAGAAGRPAPES